MVEKSLSDLDFNALIKREFFPSPVAWEDEVLYFLMLDRFSNGNEKGGYRDNNGKKVTTGTTPLYRDPQDTGNATRTDEDRRRWEQAGNRFVGGTLKGLESKIGYLKRLGITAIWVSPIFRQVAFKQTYHGYGIQNFIDVDPRFGTREDLKSMVDTAHKHGIRVILDIILNHSGDVFAYKQDNLPCEIKDNNGNVIGHEICWQADGRTFEVDGFRDKVGNPSIPFARVDLQRFPDAFPDGAIWPAEFQEPLTFTKKGKIKNFDNDPEFLEGDFFDLKDITHGHQPSEKPISEYQISEALLFLGEVYKFWIAFADIDGYRIDTVKHMELGATRFFSSVIHEFAQLIGKENFYLIGEVTGGRERAFNTLEETGLNAVLGINEINDRIEYLVKGFRNPSDYFDTFRNSLLVKKDSQVFFRNRIVTLFDDHDQVRKGENKARFSHEESENQKENFRVLVNALALTVTSMGIPCIYYGTEQFFNGHGNSDRFIREAMFGDEFGAFETRGVHFFNEDQRAYKELAEILKIRKEKIALRRSRQFLRPISGDGVNFGEPRMFFNIEKGFEEIRSIVPWSRLFENTKEILLAINTDYINSKSAWVTIDNSSHETGEKMKLLYAYSFKEEEKKLIKTEVTVEERNGKSVFLTLPGASFVIYE